MRKQLLGVSIIALTLLVGCKAPQQFGGVPRNKVYKAIASLSPSTTELLAQFSIQMVGRTAADDYPAVVKQLRVVADLKPNYEALSQAHADLIVLDPKLYSDAEITKLKSVADVYPFEANSLDEFTEACYKLGNKIGGESGIMDYLDKVQRQRKVAEAEKLPNPVKAVLILPDPTGHHMIAGVKSFQADLIKTMGATPIGPDSIKFEPLNAEYLISQNPDVIAVAGDSKKFLSDTRFANVKAEKEGKVFEIDPNKILRTGSRVDSCIYEGHKALMLLYTKG